MSSCKQCTRARAALYRQATRRARRERVRFVTYGLTGVAYDNLLAHQGGRCAICLRPPEADKELHVDHDHASGAVRGLLCRMCNKGLGHFEDEIERMTRAIQYLAEPTARRIER